MAFTDWTPATCMPDNCFCEAVRAAGLRQPSDTLTNLGFILVGAWILAKGFSLAGPGSGPLGRIGRSRLQTLLYGAIVFGLGVGSALFHGTMTYVGEWVDVLSMFVLPGYLLLYNLARLGRLEMRGFVWVLLALSAAFAALIAISPDIPIAVYGSFLALLLVVEFLARARLPRDARWLSVATILFVLGYGIWQLDRWKTLCAPQSWMQGHSAWHLLCAVATAALYRYYASEQESDAGGA